jgi:hypothetical protein
VTQGRLTEVTESLTEVAAGLSGGGFSNYFMRPRYQFDAVEGFLQAIGNQHAGHFKCARCRNLTIAYFVICAAFRVVATPTSSHKRKISNSSSKTFSLPGKARPSRFQCVFPYSLLFRAVSSIFNHQADRHFQTVAGIISLLNDFERRASARFPQ